MKTNRVPVMLFVALVSSGSLAGCANLHSDSPKPQTTSAVATGQGGTATANTTSPAAAAPTAPASGEASRPMTLKQAQTKLNDLGFKVGKADGRIGPRTRAGLRRFQQSRGIAATGQLDAATIAELSK